MAFIDSKNFLPKLNEINELELEIEKIKKGKL